MRYLPAFIVDAVLVLIFAAIGRSSHEEDPAGFLLTAWPFLVALLVGHVLAAMIGQRPRRPWSLLSGIVIWVVTVAGGVLVRLTAGDTAELPFIIVATLVLGVFIVGWRALTALLRRRRTGGTRPATAAPEAASETDAAVDSESSEQAGLEDEGSEGEKSDGENSAGEAPASDDADHDDTSR